MNNDTLLQILSVYLGVLNINENREQSAHNDVSAANDKQAQYMLAELKRLFDEQNEKLDTILKLLEGKNEDN